MVKFLPVTITYCYATHLCLRRRRTPASLLILCPRKVPGEKGIYREISSIIRSPFHKTLLVDIYSFCSCYRLIWNVYDCITCLYYFDYHRPELLAHISCNARLLSNQCGFFFQYSLFQRILESKRFVLLTLHWKQGLLKRDRQVGKLCKSWCTGGGAACICVWLHRRTAKPALHLKVTATNQSQHAVPLRSVFI